MNMTLGNIGAIGSGSYSGTAAGMGQAPAAGGLSEELKKNSTEEEFLAWAKMSPIERMRASFLKARNLTEESLQELPEAERKAIEREMEKAIREAMAEKDKKDGVVQAATFASFLTP
jgi:20S proteasome alpha/beta subunit